MRESRYKDKESVVLESSTMAVSVIPSVGGKVASLVDKAAGYEFMVQRAGSLYRDQPYDGVYVEGECSGFDDMFPTIDECHYESFPWKGTRLPDHGEVWSLPWEHEVGSDSLRLWVHGVRLPYLLEKRLSFTAENTLRIAYTLFNQSPFDLDFLWAAHVMANIEEGSRILLPPCCRTAVTTLSRSGRMGRYGDAVIWPEHAGPDGQRHRADLTRPGSVHDMEKYYFQDALDEGWCAVRAPAGGLLALSFPVARVPYLGILLNDKEFQDYLASATCLGSSTQDADEFVDANRLRGKIDHSTAGAQFIWGKLANSGQNGRIAGQLLALCISSHHSGLIDCLGPDGEDNFTRRISKAERNTHLAEAVTHLDPGIAGRVDDLVDRCHLAEDLVGVIKVIVDVEKNAEGSKTTMSFKIGSGSRAVQLPDRHRPRGYRRLRATPGRAVAVSRRLS